MSLRSTFTEIITCLSTWNPLCCFPSKTAARYLVLDGLCSSASQLPVPVLLTSVPTFQLLPVPFQMPHILTSVTCLCSPDLDVMSLLCLHTREQREPGSFYLHLPTKECCVNLETHFLCLELSPTLRCNLCS